MRARPLQGALVPARPFRVNAGPVHSYILLADESTKYLEEVVPGDNVLVLDAHGATRTVTVGRCKIEPRPLLLLSFEADGARGQVFLQQAETVRLIVESGEHGALEVEARSVTEIQVGDRLRVRRTARGTHVGRAISARVEEK
jgi:3-dehydroquinate synthase II